MKYHLRYNREHWLTSHVATFLWMCAMSANWDSVWSHGGWAWVPTRWRWERPRLHRWVTESARWVERRLWRWVAWHFSIAERPVTA